MVLILLKLGYSGFPCELIGKQERRPEVSPPLRKELGLGTPSKASWELESLAQTCFFSGLRQFGGLETKGRDSRKHGLRYMESILRRTGAHDLQSANTLGLGH